MQHLSAVLLAMVAAAVMAGGTQLQSLGVADARRRGHETSQSVGVHQLVRMAATPRWLIGTVLLGLAVAMQIGALSLAPLIVVQPIGVIALVISSILNARLNHLSLGRLVHAGMGMSVLGIGVFVVVAAMIARDSATGDRELITLLIVLGILLIPILAAEWLVSGQARALASIVSAGVLYGFVSTFAKTLIGMLQHGRLGFLAIGGLAGLAVAVLLGGWIVQNAHAAGPPDLVMAGLTVIDPIVAVLLGMIVLHEAEQAPFGVLVIFAASGALAVAGVLAIARGHPQIGATGQASLRDIEHEEAEA